MPRYEYSDGKSRKFWSIELSGSDVVLHWGRIGTKGQSKRKHFDSPVDARDEYRKSIASKEAKGYCLAASDADAESISRSDTNEDDKARRALLSFVTDLTQGDEDMLNQVRSLIADPPEATAQAMGFYPRGDQDAFERVFLKTVSTLDEFGYLHSWEDKYVASMLYDWIASDFIPASSLSPQTVYYAEKLRLPTSRLGTGWGARDLPDDEARELAEQFERAAADVEAAVSRAGRSLLSIDISGGDHLYGFSVATAVADKWRDVLFWTRENGDPLAVRGFMWKQFAEFLKYANGVELKTMTGTRANQKLRTLTRQHTAIASPQRVEAQEPVRVRHAKFGTGQVVREIDAGDARKLEIHFEDGTVRTILARFTEPL